MGLPKLLLLHGALGAASQFDELKKILEPDFDVYTFNFPGHGGRKIPDLPFSFSLFIGDLLQFLEEKKIERIDIFGYSMGGYAALRLVRHHASKVGKIFTLATKFDWNEQTSKREAGMLNPEKMEEKIPAFAKMLADRHAPADWKEVVNKTREMILHLGKNHLEKKDFKAIKHSITISVGEQDNMVGMDESRSTAANLQDGKFISFPHMQHPFEKLDFLQLVPELNKFYNER